MLKLAALAVVLSHAASSETCKENAVVGHCLYTGCFMGHGKATCHGTKCICDPGTCSVDGHRCVQKPSALQAGKVVKFFKADGTSPNRWLSFTATNDEFEERWFHYMRFVYSYGSAMPAKLFEPKSVLQTFTPNDTFCLQNVYGHGYAPYWVGMERYDGRLRESYTNDRDKLPIKFVKVGCNRYKMQTFYIGNHRGKFVGQAGRMWISGTDDFEHGVVVSVWGVEETVDECGNPLPEALAEEVESTTSLSELATLGFLGASSTGLIIAAVVRLRHRRAAPELKQTLLIA